MNLPPELKSEIMALVETTAKKATLSFLAKVGVKPMPVLTPEQVIAGIETPPTAQLKSTDLSVGDVFLPRRQ